MNKDIDQRKEKLNAMILMQKELRSVLKLDAVKQSIQTHIPAMDRLSIDFGVIKFEGVLLSDIILTEVYKS